MSVIFPRKKDTHRPAWQHEGPEPLHPWERFSPAYEAQAEGVARALEARGFRVVFGGAGSEDGEFIAAADESGEFVFLVHLEEPETGEMLANLDETGLKEWIERALNTR